VDPNFFFELFNSGELLFTVLLIAAAVLGFFALLTVLFGILGRKKKGFAITGLILGILTLLLIIGVAVLSFPFLFEGLAYFGYLG